MTDHPFDPAFADMLQLVYPAGIYRPAAVDRLRTVLNDHGYDATDRDIQSAAQDWVNERPDREWVGMKGMTDEELFSVLWDRLQHDDGRFGTPGEGYER